MRIAFIVFKFPVLSETFILNQITNLLDLGHDVTIFATSRSSDTTVHPDVDKYNLLERTHYIDCPKKITVRIFKSLRLFIKYFRNAPMLLMRSLNLFKYGKEAVSIRLLFLAAHFTEPYDIVHCHYGLLGDIGVTLKKLGARINKIAVSFHGYDITVHIKKHGQAVYRNLFEKADLFLPISDNWRNKLIQLGCPQNKIMVHRMGVDANKFIFQPKHLSPGQMVRLISIARLIEKKGLEYSIRAVSRLSKSYPNMEYIIIGDGPLRNNLEELIKKEGSESVVRLVGWKTQDEVSAFLTQAHIMLAASVTSSNGDQEGIPVVLMEAMAMGLPIISTVHSGIPELVQDGVSGYLVPERDVDAIQQKLKVLISHPESWETMGRRGRACVEESFNSDKLNQQIVQLYENLLV